MISGTDFRVTIGNLPNGGPGGPVLARTAGNVITIDATAGGFGWSRSDARRRRRVRRLSGTPRMDLLTVLIHELGHVLGWDVAGRTSDPMNGTLAPGVRRGPAATE